MVVASAIGHSGFNWTALGVISAILGLIITLVLTLRGQNQEKELADNAAARAEAAARLTESYTQRVVDALEAIAAGGLGGTAPAEVRWSMDWRSGDTYILENIGSATAHDIGLSADPTLVGPQNVTGGPDVAPGEALTFMALVLMETRDTTITVSWTDDADDPKQWRYPLPPAPRPR